MWHDLDGVGRDQLYDRDARVLNCCVFRATPACVLLVLSSARHRRFRSSKKTRSSAGDDGRRSSFGKRKTELIPVEMDERVQLGLHQRSVAAPRLWLWREDKWCKPTM